MFFSLSGTGNLSAALFFFEKSCTRFAEIVGALFIQVSPCVSVVLSLRDREIV